MQLRVVRELKQLKEPTTWYATLVSYLPIGDNAISGIHTVDDDGAVTQIGRQNFCH
jgi:hypothetical protein